MASTILMVEDDPNTQQLVKLYLTRDGFRVISAEDGLEGLRLARQERPDLVVLDLMLPKLSGMEVCRTLRSESDTPIIMLTARVQEEDRLAGLDEGADDYVTKPFSPKELVARVKAVLRRTARDAAERGPPEMSYGDVTVNLHRRTVALGGKSLSLTPAEFRLLTMFLREPGRTFTRQQIIDKVFGYDFEGFDRAVDAHVSNLRHKVEPDGKRPKYIQTVYGVGYKFGDA